MSLSQHFEIDHVFTYRSAFLVIIAALLFYKYVILSVIWVLVSITFLLYAMLTFTSPAVEHRPPKLINIEPYSVETDREDNNELFSEYPEISQEIGTIIDFILRDFIMSWFQSINGDKESQFPSEVRKCLRHAAVEFYHHFESVNIADLLVLKLLPLVTKHFNTFSTAHETAISDTFLDKPHKNMDLAVAVEFNKNYKVHRGISLNSKTLSSDIENYLRNKVSSILPQIIDKNELNSTYVRILLREILTCCIFSPLVEKLSDPDFWNLKMVKISSDILRERSQVQELRAVLSKEIETQDKDTLTSSDSGEDVPRNTKIDITIDSSGADFEEFLKQISSLSTLSDLKAKKFLLMIKMIELNKLESLSKKQVELEKRLQLSLNLLESRIAYISGNFSTMKSLPSNSRVEKAQLHEFEMLLESISLDVVLSNEFCFKRLHDFLAKEGTQYMITYLDFWEYVENVKNPLEDPNNDEIAMDLIDHGVMDLKNAYNAFLVGENLKKMKSLSPEYVKDITEFVHAQNSEKEPAVSLYLQARRSLLLLQVEAFKNLQKHSLPKFKSSTMFLEMISSQSFTSTEFYLDYMNITKKETSPHQPDSRLTSVRIVANGDISKALDDILKSKDETQSNVYSQRPKKSFSNLFGKESDTELFQDSLFDDNSIAHEDEYSDIDDSPDAVDYDSSSEIVSSDVLDHEYGQESSMLEFVELKDRIAKLTISIDRLHRQLVLLGHLILKAELTNNKSQLKLLKRSERSVTKELEYKELLKQQYTVQENANSLLGKTQLSIKSYFTDISENDGKEVTYYVISVNHLNNNQITSWEIPRRFSEFYKLNTYLKKTYKSLVRHLQTKGFFPEKVKMSLKYHVSKTLLYEERTTKLETYLRELVIIPEVCQDKVFRRFLTDASGTFCIEEDKNTDDKRKLPSLSRIESVPSKINESLHSDESEIDVSKRYSGMAFQVTPLKDDFEKEISFYNDERNFYSNISRSRKTSFVKPICDLFISIFSLNKSNSGWLRGRALLAVLQKLLGSTIEKYIKDLISKVKSEEKIYELILSVKNVLWVNDTFFKSSQHSPAVPRTEGERKRTETEAKLLIEKLMIELCAKVVGIRNSKDASLKLYSMVQNEYLNASLILETLDLILDEIFPTND